MKINRLKYFKFQSNDLDNKNNIIMKTVILIIIL